MAKHDYDKILTRLTTILQRLHEGEALCTKELADEFNVNEKTIRRDFNERLVVSYPIYQEKRKWKMQEGFRLEKKRTPEETLVLEMLENIAHGISHQFGTKAKILFSKLQNDTKNPILSRTIIEDISDRQDLFHSVENAIANHVMVTFEFKGKHRQMNPYKIVSFEGYWYLYGEDTDQNKLKTFYFKDIKKLTLTEQNFTPDPSAYEVVKRAINVWFEPNNKPFEVYLHAHQNIAKYFLRRPLSSTQRIERIYPDESMHISLLATSEQEILHEIKKWMPQLVIISPAHLIQKSKEIAEEFLNRI